MDGKYALLEGIGKSDRTTYTEFNETTACSQNSGEMSTSSPGRMSSSSLCRTMSSFGMEGKCFAAAYRASYVSFDSIINFEVQQNFEELRVFHSSILRPIEVRTHYVGLWTRDDYAFLATRSSFQKKCTAGSRCRRRTTSRSFCHGRSW